MGRDHTSDANRVEGFERIKCFAGAGVGDQGGDPAESEPEGAKGVRLEVLQGAPCGRVHV